MQETINKNIKFQFAELIKFADKFDNRESKEKIYKVLNLLSGSDKNIIKNNSEYTSEICNIIINDTGGGVNTLIAAVFYSFYKKEDIDSEYIKNEYGTNVLKILTGLYKIPILKTEKIDKQAEQFIKFLLTVTDDVRAILIMLAAELYKIRHIDEYNEEEKASIINKSKAIYTPLAHRIGLYNIKTEFEEKTMKYSEEDMYRFIAKKLKETKATRDTYIESFITPLKKVLKEAGYNFTIKGRPKSIHSIWNKMKSQNVPFEEVYDLFAIRIILKSDFNNEKSVCWNVYSIITDLYKPNPKRLRDWISSPKLSGYESLHTTVLGAENKWVEVQIRTERMDEVAEKGPAAHWRYKTGKEGGSNNWLAKIRETLENAGDYENETDESSKSQLYSEEILVFTPEGDLKSLKKDYTVLDFAFSVHTKVGETCSGAVVNNKIQPLSYILKNGDTVKILTNKNKKPNTEWLDIAKGTRTKNKIKRALKSITFNRAESGKDIIKEKLERLKFGFSEKNIELLTDHFNFKTAVEFYHSVGEGTVDISKIKQAFEKKKTIEDEIITEIKTDTGSQEKEDVNYGDFLLIDENISDLDYTLSKCCNPLPGEDIFGFVTVNKGTRIHKKTCPNAKDMLGRYPYRAVKAKWNISDINSSFSANIYISGKDFTGITSVISDIITKEFNLKMQAISLKSLKNSMFEGNVIAKVNNKKQMIDLINRLKILKNIKTVFHK
ncbi:MAG: HD domain-containing protein [Bacteroidales bacterium]|nr:HD domain-containing protein [Bacteroidales bacterium]